MRLLQLGIVLALATAASADMITMKNGRVINGTYLGGSARQVRVEVGDRIETLDVTDVSRIEFGGGSSSAPVREPVREPERPTLRRQSQILRPDDNPPPPPPPAASARGPIELPSGTNLVVRLIDGVDSEVNRVGQTFAASLDEPVMLNGETLIPRGVDVTLKLVDAKESGKLTGKAELTLDLVSVRVNGRMVDINTQTVSRESSSRGERTAKVAGGTAAVGAIIGAIAGGGKGAAIGAAAGGAAGAGAEVVTKGQKVKIPSETRLTFVIDNPVTI
ncbi:MAG TPA: hypothetical protein VGF59_16535 [Bryobacteraceae bacterium]